MVLLQNKLYFLKDLEGGANIFQEVEDPTFSSGGVGMLISIETPYNL